MIAAYGLIQGESPPAPANHRLHRAALAARLAGASLLTCQPPRAGMTSDLNIAWTKGHYKLVNWMPSQFLILFASAWSLTENYPLALITCAIYCECRASSLAVSG